MQVLKIWTKESAKYNLASFKMLAGCPEIPGDDDESKSLSKSMTSSFVILTN